MAELMLRSSPYQAGQLGAKSPGLFSNYAVYGLLEMRNLLGELL
mgnify:CR=1 FL=1